jgi:hypothetical protein
VLQAFASPALAIESVIKMPGDLNNSSNEQDESLNIPLGPPANSADLDYSIAGETAEDSRFGTYTAPAPVLGAEEQRFLKAFSWAPGCGFYFWSNAMYPFLVFSLVLTGMNRAVNLMTESTENGNVARLFGLSAVSLLVIGASFALLVWAGKVSRQRRWQILQWDNFEQFRVNERAWTGWGIAGWAIMSFSFVVTFLAAVYGSLKN